MSTPVIKKFIYLFQKIDKRAEIGYNKDMKKVHTAIIGGGAAGLFLASMLTEYNATNDNQIPFALLERNDRLGKKLSATGNGQGNVTNLSAGESEYFSVCDGAALRAQKLVNEYSQTQFQAFWEKRGVLLTYDERGRAYPASRQASALTDALRYHLSGADVHLQARVTDIERENKGFAVRYQKDGENVCVFAENVVLCCGGKSAKNFGTDGSAYALAKAMGHSVTPLYPSLVQLKTELLPIKTLKGIRVMNGGLTAFVGGKKYSLRGDIIFTDYGVSGDAVFRLSAFLADKIGKTDVRLCIDFLPERTEEEIYSALKNKRAAFPSLAVDELLFGIVNNQVGRAVIKRADSDLAVAAKLVKAFPLQVTGSLGFDYAQVTKGGVPLAEVDEGLQSKLAQGLYFAGEMLDVDGQCGGFNLQWAYSSACTVYNALLAKTLKNTKRGGQV